MEIDGAQPQPTTERRKPLLLGDDCRHQIVNKIVDTLQSIQISGPDEPRKQAVQFEDGIFRSASNQDDYFRQIRLNILLWKGNAMPTASAGNPDTGLPLTEEDEELKMRKEKLKMRKEELKKKEEVLKKTKEDLNKIKKRLEEIRSKKEEIRSKRMSIRQIMMKRRGLLSKQCPTQLQRALERMSFNS